VRYCQTSYRQQKLAADALAAAKHELATVRNCAAEDHSKALALQQENKQLRALAQQAGEVNSLRAEVQRLQHLGRDVDQFNAEVEAFRRLKADVRDLDTFRRNKSAILQHLKLVPKLVE
jgi:DNA repair ATPase RecN